MLTAVVLPKLAGETRTTVVDFSPALIAGQVAGTPTVTVSVYSGIDPSPPTFTMSVTGTQTAVVENGGVAGTIYSVLVTLPTIAPIANIQLQYFLAVVPPTY